MAYRMDWRHKKRNDMGRQSGMTRQPAPDEAYGALQEIVNELYGGEPGETDEDLEVRRLDVILAVEWADLPEELQEVVRRLPPGNYTRQALCFQLNSILTGHAYATRYGTVA